MTDKQIEEAAEKRFPFIIDFSNRTTAYCRSLFIDGAKHHRYNNKPPTNQTLLESLKKCVHSFEVDSIADQYKAIREAKEIIKCFEQ